MDRCGMQTEPLILVCPGPPWAGPSTAQSLFEYGFVVKVRFAAPRTISIVGRHTKRVDSTQVMM